MIPKLLHIGVVVSSAGGISAGHDIFKLLGYSETFRRRRSAPWIGEIVGIPGADIEILHMAREGDPVGIELLAYHAPYPGPRIGIQHLAFEVDDIEKAALSFPGNLYLRGSATIPDGPYAGTQCAYLGAGAWRLDDPDDWLKIELIQKPKTPVERTIDAIEGVRARSNKLWMSLVRLSMEKFPAEARAIFDQIEANDAKILELSSWMRGAPK